MANKESKKNKSKLKNKEKQSTKAKLKRKKDKSKSNEAKASSKKGKSKSSQDKARKKEKLQAKAEKLALTNVRVADTECGFGVFAKRDFPEAAIVGEITGEIIVDAEYGSDYCLHLGGPRHLEPSAPFRFLNHSCEPNCEFDWFVAPGEIPGDKKPRMRVFVSTIEEIREGEQLTIDYNWPADVAIPCLCGTESCRGWVVCPEELHLVKAGKKPKKRKAS